MDKLTIFALFLLCCVHINVGGELILDDFESESWTEDLFNENVTSVNSFSNYDVERPGFKARITQKGFDFAARLAINILMKELKNLEIPDVYEDVGVTKVHVRNIRMTRFSRPRSSLEPIPWPGYGLRWQTTHLDPIITAEYETAFDVGLWVIKKTGTVTVEASDLQFKLDFFMGMEEGGRPTAEVLNCHCTGDLDVSFEGEWSDMLNVGSTLFAPHIESLITAQICFQAKQEINSKLGEQFKNMPLVHTIHDDYLLNLSMVHVPLIYPDAMEIGLSGAVKLVDDPQEPPYIAPDMPVRHEDTEKMFYVSLTDYFVNTAFYATYVNDLLAYRVRADMVPEEQREYLKTTCDTGICLGTIFPKISDLYPNDTVGMYIAALEPPTLNILGNILNVSASGSVDVFAENDGEEASVFVLDVTMNGSFAIHIANSSVVIELIDIYSSSSGVEILDSNIGDFGSGFFFESILRVITQQVLKPKITELGEKGVGIPKVKGVEFVNPVIIQSNTPGVLIIGTDIGFEVKKKRMMSKRKFKKHKQQRKRAFQ